MVPRVICLPGSRNYLSIERNRFDREVRLELAEILVGK